MGESRSDSIHIVPCCQIIAAVIRNLRFASVTSAPKSASLASRAYRGHIYLLQKRRRLLHLATSIRHVAQAKAVPPASPVPGPNPFIDASYATARPLTAFSPFPALPTAVAALESEATAKSDNGPCL